jgi:CheY-like chemotaxis protein
MTSRDQLFRLIKDALENLYDPVHLQTHPLLDILPVSHEPGRTRGAHLRQLLWDAVEQLQPTEPVSSDRPEWLSYNLLMLQYIHAMERPAVCRELGLSEAAYYRRQRAAVEAVTSLIWEQHMEGGQDVDGESPAIASSAERAKEEAMRLALRSTSTPIDLNEVLRSAERTAGHLARDRGVAVRVSVSGEAPAIYGDPMVLEQIILNVLTEGIGLAGPEGIRLTVDYRDDAIAWQLCGLKRQAQVELSDVSGIQMSRGLLEELYGGRLWCDEAAGNHAAVFWTIPVARRKVVLIIEDDEDTVGLYRRFLGQDNYVVQVLSGGEDLAACLGRVRPDVILLDVLMPGEGGWHILESLKTLPETADIPVVVCSVLTQPSLALSIGATAVLGKPITQEVLLRALRSALPG